MITDPLLKHLTVLHIYITKQHVRKNAAGIYASCYFHVMYSSLWEAAAANQMISS